MIRSLKHTILTGVLFATSVISLCSGQVTDAVDVRGEFLKLIDRNESLNEAVAKAVELAKVDALEQAFGRVVFQGNTTFVQNLETGDRTESRVAFSSVGGSFVNGEWIQDIQIDTLVLSPEDLSERYVKVVVVGKARKLPDYQTNCESFTASCAERNCRTQQFTDGQYLFFHFTASENGFVVVYVDDPQLRLTQKVIPSTTESSIQVLRNVPSVFPGKLDPKIEMRLSPENELEAYKVFVLFSPAPLEQPVLRDLSTENQYLSSRDKEKGFLFPPSLESERFQRWLQAFRLRNRSVQLQILTFSLHK